MSQPAKNASARIIVDQAWGAAAPQWVKKLAEACDRDSQSAVARKISRSPSLVNMVLKNTYQGSLQSVQGRFEAAYKESDIQCPILGCISGSTCLNTQGEPYNPGNHVAVRLFLSCRTCPHNIKAKG
jgi:hypothetical protein